MKDLVTLCVNEKEFIEVIEKYYKEKFFTYVEWYRTIACGKMLWVVTQNNSKGVVTLCTIQFYYDNINQYEIVNIKGE